MHKCLECSEHAEVHVSWCGSMGEQNVAFCSVHALHWWNLWKNTPAGLTAVFEPLTN